LSGTFDQIMRDLLHWEGDAHHLYRDHHGLVTVGVGNLVQSAVDAIRLPFVDKKTGAPATPEQIAHAFEAIKHQPVGFAAHAYAAITNIRLSEDSVRTLAQHRLEHEFLPGLHRLFPNFDSFPAPAKRAFVDMAYNLGIEGLGRFHQLRTAVEAGDWRAAAGECHRRTCRAERNDFVRQLFLEAAAQTAPSPSPSPCRTS
jgi:GH24 family phage-related lysozyme (muramidase)